MQVLCHRGASMKALARFLRRFCIRILSGLLQALFKMISLHSFCPGRRILVTVFCDKIGWGSWWMLPKAFAWSCASLCEKFLMRSWWNPFGVLTWFRTGACEKILGRSCWNPRGPCIEVLRMLCIGACMAVYLWCSWDTLVWRLVKFAV